MGGDALGGAVGKSMFGSDESKKVMPVAGPLMMKDAGKDIPPVMGDIAKSFAPTRPGPLMLNNPGQEATAAVPGAVKPGDAAHPVMLPPVRGVLPTAPSAVNPSNAARAMMPGPVQVVLPTAPSVVKPGDAARSIMMPPASADAAAGPLAAAVVAKVQPAKIETKVDIHAPFSLTVQGDVKDPNELMAQLQPLLDQHRREIAQQLDSRKLYDAPHT
ncbi:hypothetical protein [Pseudomonas synxantha]|uniref:hypothetical protein n=1 Tax=Pseudomonas synxantha TaxID=47883 RepID=UPI00278F955C|nr:hypothetical protein [Pseudomonas synxantha]